MPCIHNYYCLINLSLIGCCDFRSIFLNAPPCIEDLGLFQGIKKACNYEGTTPIGDVANKGWYINSKGFLTLQFLTPSSLEVLKKYTTHLLVLIPALCVGILGHKILEGKITGHKLFMSYFKERFPFYHVFYLICFYMGTEKLWHFFCVSHPALSVIFPDPDDTI